MMTQETCPILKTNWKTWAPRETGVLCFIIKNGQILLIHKKRGLGAGKINGPGGKLDPGETPLQAAIRETQEEVGLTPLNPQLIGELKFQFADDYSLHCYVYRALDYEGELCETDEALPEWFPTGEIPFHRMWQDDELWFHHLLEGTPFQGQFTFDDDKMLWHKVQLCYKGTSENPHKKALGKDQQT